MGRSRRRAASIAASIADLPSFSRSRANSTIKIAFFDDNPIVVSNPTWKNTSFSRCNTNAEASAPSKPSGTTMITEIGIVQLSYSAARLKNTTRIDSAYSIGADDPDNCSCNETPVHSWPTPAGRSFIRRSISAIA